VKIICIVILFNLLSAAAVQAQLPEAPQLPPAGCVDEGGSSCVNWSLDRPTQRTADTVTLRSLSWSKTFKSKTLWAVEGIEAAAIIGNERDVFIGASRGCLVSGENGPYKPSFGRVGVVDWAFQFLPSTVVGVLFRKIGLPLAPYSMQLTMAAKHSLAMAHWHQSGCLK
jgi:hypothetical protein